MNTKIILLFLLIQFAYCINYIQAKDDFRCIDRETSCSNNGECNKNSTSCICSDAYATYNCDSDVQCCYKRQKQLAPLIIQAIPFTAPLGIGFFIIGQVGYGILLLALTTGGFCVLPILMCCLIGIDSDKCFFVAVLPQVLYGLSGLAVLALYIWGIVVFAQCSINDGNGVGLYCNA